MKNFINIILMNIRHDLQARLNILIAIEVARKYDFVKVSIGYGGVNDDHVNWIKSNLSELDGVNLLVQDSILSRFSWALEIESDWVIFLSDDDPITTNYLDILINEINRSDLSIANIFPKYYALTDGGATEVVELNSIIGDEPFVRFVEYVAGKNAGIRYYSAHRSGTIKSLVKDKILDNFFPSYLDQLIVASSIIDGNSIPCEGANFFVYDYGNWRDLQNSIISDAKFYKEKSMLFYHEIYWIKDYLKLCYNYLDYVNFFNWFKSYVLIRLEYSLAIFNARRAAVTILDCVAENIFNQIVIKYNSVRDCSSRPALLAALEN